MGGFGGGSCTESGDMEIGLGDGCALLGELGEEEGSDWISLGSLYKDKSLTTKQNTYPCLFFTFSDPTRKL